MPKILHPVHRYSRKHEDLALFTELQRREKQADAHKLEAPKGISCMALFNSSEEDILSLFDWDKHDYDWLMTPPTVPAVSALGQESEDMETRPSSSAAASSTPNSKLGVSDCGSKADPSSDQGRRRGPHQVLIRRPSNSILPSSDPSSSSIPSLSRTIHLTTPIPQSTARPPTPTRAGAPSRSIYSSKGAGRAATLSSRPIGSAKPSTSARGPPTPSRLKTSSSTQNKSSFVSQAIPLPPKSASSSRSSSLPSRARHPATHPSVLSDPAQEPAGNLRPLMVDRPVSNPRGLSMSARGSVRALAKSTLPRLVDDNGTPNRRPSSSPSKGRTSSTVDRFSVRNGRARDDAVVLVPNGIGSKMGEKVMAPRKVAFPSQGREPKLLSSQPKKPVKSMPTTNAKSTALLHESWGFGRGNLSRQSVDMALRHMDISGNTASDSQSFMANISAPSICSVRSINGRGMPASMSTSTSSIFSSSMATSRNASSGHRTSTAVDPQSSDFGDESSSDFGSRASSMAGSRASPICQADRSLILSNERRVSCWVGTQGYMDDSDASFMEIFEGGFKTLSGPESLLLVSLEEGVIKCDDFTLDAILGDEGVLAEASQKLEAFHKEENGSGCNALP